MISLQCSWHLLQLNGKNCSAYKTKLDDISSTPIHKDGIAPCNHEEMDTRIFIHIAHAASDGLLKAIIHTVDTYVVILAIANVHKIQNLDELWIAFGTGKN